MTTYSYTGVLAQQRDDANAPQTFLFQASVGEILQWAFVHRLEPTDRTGFQRSLNSRKVREVTRFFAADTRDRKSVV